MNKLKCAALRYTELGWSVFPIHTPTGEFAKPCSCRKTNCPQIGKHLCHSSACKEKVMHPCHQSVCDRVGKHPRTRSGVRDSTTDKEQIRQWWDMWPGANIGIAAGKDTGFFVLDVDPRKGGDEALAAFESRYGKLPETRIADTGGGGTHHLFKHPSFCVKNSTGRLGPGLDIKGEGGAIVVAPSLHASGKRYRWRNDAPIVEAPEWFLRLLREEQKSRTNVSAAIGERIPEGQRNDTLTSLAGTMRRRGMGVEEIEAALLVTNSERCNPPLPEGEVRKISASVCRYKPAGGEDFR